MIEREGGIQTLLPDFELQGERFDSLPYSDLKRWVGENDIYEKAFQNFPMERLHEIKALSFLSCIGLDLKHTVFLEYPHTRLDHSFTVAIVMEKILRQNGFEDAEINVGIIAGLIHDIATPACGDATKKIDPEALDEEKFWWKTIGEKGQEFITDELGIAKETVDDIIKNKSLLGQVLDIADRITYTMKDLDAIVRDDGESNFLAKLDLDPALLPLRYIISHYPQIGNIYKEVGVDRKRNEVFFNNPKHLEVLLLLRTRLCRDLYYSPVSLGRDFLVGQLMLPLYSRNGATPLTAKKLRDLTDYNLMEILQKAYCQPKGQITGFEMQHDLVNWHPLFKKFENNQEAEEFAKRLRRRKNMAVVGVTECKGFDPATSYKVVNREGKTMPFFKFDPSTAKEIEEITKATKGVFVFYADVAEKTHINNLLKLVSMSAKSGLKP